MSSNPYESPSIDEAVTGVLSGDRADLRAVARHQKGILMCILLNFIVVFGQMAVPVTFRPILGWSVLAIGLAGTAFVILLAMKVYSPVFGVVLGLLAFVPLAGLLVLLSVNGKATRILKQNGIRVGLLGADLSMI